MERLFENLRTNHRLSHIDARIKLLVSLFVLAMVLSCRDLLLPVLVTSLCLFLLATMKIPLRIVALRYLEPLLIASMVLVLKCFFTGSDPLVSLDLLGFSITAHRDGLREGALIAARISGSVSILIALGFSTPFTELMVGLCWFRVPRGFIEILMFAYRYLFELFEEAQVICVAQRNRLGYSSVKRSLGSLGTLAGALTIRAFDRSHQTAVAMVQRGYQGSIPLPVHEPFRLSEILGSAALLLFVATVWSL